MVDYLGTFRQILFLAKLRLMISQIIFYEERCRCRRNNIVSPHILVPGVSAHRVSHPEVRELSGVLI
jgi:hypothetical protein